MADHRYRILIVDDSTFMRMALRGALEKEPDIEIVGVAGDGQEAVEKALALKPDLITMDIEMPRLNGIEALRQIMAKAPTRVIMVSGLTTEGAAATFEALEAGAMDYIVSKGAMGGSLQQFREAFIGKVRNALEQGVKPARRTVIAPQNSPPVAVSSPRPRKFGEISCIGIGASTGGPVAVLEVISQLPANYPYPVLIGIHMPKTFTGAYAERLASRAQLPVREAVDKEIIKPGTILLAPGGQHTSLVKVGSSLQVRIIPSSEAPQHIYIPCIDEMFYSMSEATKGACLGVVLTGMGSDGCKGVKKIKEMGGYSIIQNEATCTIYGMPKACIDAGLADTILPLNEIGTELSKLKR